MMDTTMKGSLQSVQGTWKTVSVAAQQKNLAQLAAMYMKNDGLVIVWQYHRVIWGRWTKGGLTFSDGADLDEGLILEVRLFNDREELHLRRSGTAYTGRYICDGEGTSGDFVDTSARLWGELQSFHDGYAVLKDTQRFITLTIPAAQQAPYYVLTTRNYITIHENGQAGYGDYRFLAVTPWKGGH
ncbi:CRISPR-associated protein Csx19 [uncultured Megasphaera sp.]|uniref:type III-D CRISPR-associated protein Csx19 n=1 Tax=uncultured Megasphaera sp. TaxID=165188 RepID=UPI002658A5B7|nr:CRISPR-associated protein Csx19 [uncultured Megasphaera sp.]